MTVVRVLLLAALHFAFAMATALLARGWDLDQVSRSAVSQAAAVIHEALMLPHDVVIQANS